jgi:dethiobiotin synthetase
LTLSRASELLVKKLFEMEVPEIYDGTVIIVSVARALDADIVVLVAPAGLGTINAVRLSADALSDGRETGARLVVALNRYDADDDLHRRNHGWLMGDDLHLVLSPAELADALRG